MHPRCLIAAAVATAASFVAGGAQAQEAPRWAPSTAFIAEGGVSEHGTYSLTAGVSWPVDWHFMSQRAEWGLYVEGFVSHWSAKQAEGGRAGFTQLGVVPIFRWRFDQGRSPWFAELGVGVSYLDRLYTTERKRFSTRFNFYDTLGAGRSFGERREHELSLRFAHVSNGGIRKPNPGENFVQLRYARHF